jgi:hypothetical protein
MSAEACVCAVVLAATCVSSLIRAQSAIPAALPHWTVAIVIITFESCVGLVHDVAAFSSGEKPSSLADVHNIANIVANSVAIVGLCLGTIASFQLSSPNTIFVAVFYACSCIVAAYIISQGQTLDEALTQYPLQGIQYPAFLSMLYFAMQTEYSAKNPQSGWLMLAVLCLGGGTEVAKRVPFVYHWTTLSEDDVLYLVMAAGLHCIGKAALLNPMNLAASKPRVPWEDQHQD